MLFGLSAANGKSLFATPISVNYFVLYAAIVMINTMALSINLNSGRFDFSLGAMAVLSSVLSAKLSYALLHGGMTTEFFSEAGVSSLMLQNVSGPVFLLASRTKLNRDSNFVRGPISCASFLITDIGAPAEPVAPFEALDITVYLL